MTAISPRARVAMTLLLLVVGVQVWLLTTQAEWRPGSHIVLMAAVAAVALLPPVQRALAALIGWLSAPSRMRRWAVAIVLGLGTLAWIIARVLAAPAPPIPQYHDEQMFLIQSQLVAHGRLWMPQHPLADFFDSFHVLMTPVYAPMHFPGTALFNAPAIWLGLAFWVVPALAMAACVALSYVVFTELMDALAGLVAAAWLLSLPLAWGMAMTIRSETFLLLLALGMYAAWMAWRKQPAWRWALMIGLCAGWAFITRPPETIAYGLPVAVAMIVQMLRMPRWAALVSLLAAAAGLAPFAAVQLAFNIGVTGSPLSTPHQLYTRQHYPHAAYGPESAGDRLPVELSPRQRKYYEEFVLSIRQAQEGRSMAAVWLNDRAPVTIRQSGPPWLVLLWPAAILCLRDPRRWVLAASLPLFVAVYWLLLVYINEYAIGAVSGVTLLALAGLEAVSALAGRRGQTVRVALLLGLCVTMSWRAWGTSRYATPHEQPVMSAVHRATQQIQGEAILLIHQADDDDPHVEPVYNTDAPYPDQARVIRAHDLGPRNAELFDYYAGIAPHRRVWRYDRSTGRLSDMGVVADLAAATTQPSRRP